MRIIHLTKETKNNLLQDLLKRSPNNYGQYESIVADIIEQVKTRKDDAVKEYTKKFDKWDTDSLSLQVTREEIDEAYTKIDAPFIEVMKKSAENIRVFHQKQLHNSWFEPKTDGTILGQKITPIAVSGV